MRRSTGNPEMSTRRRTPDELLKNSCKVNGGGIMMGFSVSSGGFDGRGIVASTAHLAFIRSAGSSASTTVYTCIKFSNGVSVCVSL